MIAAIAMIVLAIDDERFELGRSAHFDRVFSKRIWTDEESDQKYRDRSKMHFRVSQGRVSGGQGLRTLWEVF